MDLCFVSTYGRTSLKWPSCYVIFFVHIPLHLSSQPFQINARLRQSYCLAAKSSGQHRDLAELLLGSQKFCSTKGASACRTFPKREPRSRVCIKISA